VNSTGERLYVETKCELVIAEVFQNFVYVFLTKIGSFATWSLPWGTYLSILRLDARSLHR